MFDPTPFQPLIHSAPKRRYRKGTLLIQEGDSGRTIYALLSGSVRSFSSSLDEKEITYGVYGPGMIFGEMSLDGAPRSASVETLEPCECAIIEPDYLTRHLETDAGLAMALLQLVIFRARLATTAARNMALLDVYGRIKFFLENAPAKDHEGQRTLEHPITQRELAQQIGSSREMVSRVFKELETGGYICVRRTKVTLLRALPNHR